MSRIAVLFSSKLMPFLRFDISESEFVLTKGEHRSRNNGNMKSLGPDKDLPVVYRNLVDTRPGGLRERE
jgi:hypothetical protein